MGALFGPPQMPAIPTPPPAPTASSDAVVKAASAEQVQRQQASGRASTFLTDPQTQRTAQKSQQSYLGNI